MTEQYIGKDFWTARIGEYGFNGSLTYCLDQANNCFKTEGVTQEIVKEVCLKNGEYNSKDEYWSVVHISHFDDPEPINFNSNYKQNPDTGLYHDSDNYGGFPSHW